MRERLYKRSDKFAHNAYKVTKALPKEELFGLGSQLRRAAVSVPCNIIEGFSRDNWNRKSKKELLRFLEIAYGSLEESLYLINFTSKEYPIHTEILRRTKKSGEAVGKLLYSFIRNLRNTG